jgi:predicted ATPase
VGIKKEDIIPRFLKEVKLESKTLLIEHPPLSIFHLDILDFFSDRISIYDFDPKLPKKATPITGKAVLEEDGSNLAIVLKNILENKDIKRKFSNLVKDLLPFVDDLSIEKFADKSLLFKIREVYNKNLYLPASLISDGTINITALIIALYFDKKQLTIIEEPERNIHPYLISKLVEMMKDASQKKQIIVTTHNPEMVKHAGVENILLISRDKEGFSVIFRPYENETVKTFLKNELGIEELYVHNLLGL